MKVLVHRDSKKILGAAILSTGGDEAIHSILDTMYAGAPYTTVTHAMHIHPTVSELIPTILEELNIMSCNSQCAIGSGGESVGQPLSPVCPIRICRMQPADVHPLSCRQFGLLEMQGCAQGSVFHMS